MDEIRKKLKDHDARFDQADAKFERVFDKFVELENKIDNVELSLGAKIDEFQDNILSAIDAYAKKTNDIEIEQTATLAILDRHQDEIDSSKKEIIKIKKVARLA